MRGSGLCFFCFWGLRCRPVTRRGVCLLCRLSALPFALILPPIPPTPFPSGEGGDFLVFLCKGLRPLHPPEPNPSGMGTEQRILRRASACSRRHRLTRHRRQPKVACSCLVGSSRPRCPRRSRGQSARIRPSPHCFSTISVPFPLLRIQRGGTVPRTEDSG